MGKMHSADIGLIGDVGHLLAQLFWQQQGAGAHTRSDRLRKRRRVDHATSGVEVDHASNVRAREAQIAIRVIFEDPEAMLGSQIDEALTDGKRRDIAGRVLEVRDDVDQPGRLASLDCCLEGINVDAVFEQRIRVDGGTKTLQRQDRAVVGRSLNSGTSTRTSKQHFGKKREGLQRAVRDEDAGRIEAPAIANPRAQRHVTHRVAIEQHPRRILVHRARNRALELVDGKKVCGRNAACKGDSGHASQSTNPCGVVRRV